MKVIKEYTVDSILELSKTAKDIVAIIKENEFNIIRFHGHMGAGKTTLIRQMCDVIGVEDLVTSPTFAIINEYKVKNTNEMCYHFDFYRINKIEEVLDMGYEEYLYSGNLCLIEWPEMIEELLPSDNEPGINNLIIEIKATKEQQRIISLKTLI